MRKDESLFFITSETGYHLVEPIFEDNPERALNLGVAEQNMIGVASGLASVGFLPVCYAISNFLVERSFEQIRDDICFHKHKVILIGTSTGYDNGALGPTHHVVDDISVIKSLPNISIYSPSGTKSIIAAFEEAMSSKTASYIRVTKGGIDEEINVDSPNRMICESETPTLVISHGKMIGNAMEAHKISPIFSIFAMDCIKPLDHSLLNDLFKSFETIVVIEDNFRSGLYNSLCQRSIENRAHHRNIHSISPEESYAEVIGNAEYLEDKNDISPKKISNRIKKN